MYRVVYLVFGAAPVTSLHGVSTTHLWLFIYLFIYLFICLYFILWTCTREILL